MWRPARSSSLSGYKWSSQDVQAAARFWRLRSMLRLCRGKFIRRSDCTGYNTVHVNIYCTYGVQDKNTAKPLSRSNRHHHVVLMQRLCNMSIDVKVPYLSRGWLLACQCYASEPTRTGSSAKQQSLLRGTGCTPYIPSLITAWTCLFLDRIRPQAWLLGSSGKGVQGKNAETDRAVCLVTKSAIPIYRVRSCGPPCVMDRNASRHLNWWLNSIFRVHWAIRGRKGVETLLS